MFIPQPGTPRDVVISSRGQVIMEPEIFSYVHPLYYEPLSRYQISSEYLNHLRSLLPESWAFRRWEVWLGASPGVGPNLVQGFKIHVSSTPRDALATLSAVVPELEARQIPFKIAADPKLLGLLISKRYGRGGAGKFMTIYPPHDHAFRDLIEALYQETHNLPLAGPYILSDRRYKDSKILYYRYGGFQTIQRLNADGTRGAVIKAPTGEFVPDDRTPFFRLPDWVDDPFGGTRSVNYTGDRLLKSRYLIESVIIHSNAGGVYRATDTTTGATVIVKEARPYAHFWGGDSTFADAVALLQREARILQRLEPLTLAPVVVELFHEWEHVFLVESLVRGATFRSFWNHDQNILAPFVRRGGRIREFEPKFKAVAEKLLEAIERIHDAGVIFGDLSPANVFVDTEPLRLWFIDFESAYLAGEPAELSAFTRVWGTAGYADPTRRDRTALTVQDDYYGVGMLLYSAVVPAQAFFALRPEARFEFIERFVELGVPVAVQDTILALLNGDLAAAKATLARWRPRTPVPEEFLRIKAEGEKPDTGAQNGKERLAEMRERRVSRHAEPNG